MTLYVGENDRTWMSVGAGMSCAPSGIHARTEATRRGLEPHRPERGALSTETPPGWRYFGHATSGRKDPGPYLCNGRGGPFRDLDSPIPRHDLRTKGHSHPPPAQTALAAGRAPGDPRAQGGAGMVSARSCEAPAE